MFLDMLYKTKKNSLEKNCLNNIISDCWKNSYIASDNSKKILQKSTKNMKLSIIFGGFRGQGDFSYQISEAAF